MLITRARYSSPVIGICVIGQLNGTFYALDSLVVKGQKSQRFGVMHLKQLTQTNHLDLYTIFFHINCLLRKWS